MKQTHRHTTPHDAERNGVLHLMATKRTRKSSSLATTDMVITPSTPIAITALVPIGIVDAIPDPAPRPARPARPVTALVVMDAPAPIDAPVTVIMDAPDANMLQLLAPTAPIVDGIVTDAADHLASMLAAHTANTLDRNAAITNNTVRSVIALDAIKMMQRHQYGVSGCAADIARILTIRAERTKTAIPSVWRNLSNIEHALKCWLPGMCNSNALPMPWPAVLKRPFYRLNDRVMKRYLSSMPGYDSGIVTDFLSRIDPRMLTDDVLDRYELCTDRASRYDFLRELKTR